VAGAKAVLEWGPSINLLSATDGSPVTSLTFGANDSSLQPSQFVFSGDALFFSMTSNRYARIKVYTASGGVADLVTAGDDPSRGMADLGTDGRDMVWAEGSGGQNPSAPYARVTWMTSPFAINAAGVQGRRLRFEPPPFYFGRAPFVVGCGHAANYTFVGASRGVRVLRLADGQSWTLLTSGADAWHWVRPIAVTCTELFVVVIGPDGNNIARVALDSLGPGEPSNCRGDGPKATPLTGRRTGLGTSFSAMSHH
jgi:hypothetical protein